MADVEMVPVSSSNIAAVGYDEEQQRLIVMFKGGGRYAYDGVEPEVYKSFLGAGSKGRFLDQNIKGSYPFSRI